MIKAIKINENEEVTLSNSVAWLMEYKDQFQKDIVPSIMPLLAGLIDILGGVVDRVGNLDNIQIEDLLRIDDEFKTNAMIKFSAIEAADILNITWAMAKAYDDEIEPPKKWLRKIDVPIGDEIIPTIAEMAFKSVSTKNWERLKETAKSLQPQGTKKQTKKK